MPGLTLWWVAFAMLTALLAPYDRVDEEIEAPVPRPFAMLIALLVCLVIWPIKLPQWAWEKWKRR